MAAAAASAPQQLSDEELSLSSAVTAYLLAQ